MGAAGHLVLLRAQLWRVLCRQQLGSFCYPKAASDVQNLRTFSFSLSLSFQRGSRRGAGLIKWELQRRVPGSDPHAGFRLADGAEEPCSSLCSLRGAHGGGLLSTRYKLNKKKKEISTGLPARAARQTESALHPLFWWKGWGAWKGGCQRG